MLLVDEGIRDWSRRYWNVIEIERRGHAFEGILQEIRQIRSSCKNRYLQNGQSAVRESRVKAILAMDQLQSDVIELQLPQNLAKRPHKPFCTLPQKYAYALLSFR